MVTILQYKKKKKKRKKNEKNPKKPNNPLEHKKDHDIWRCKSRSWFETGIICGRITPVNGIPTFPFDNWTSNGIYRYKQNVRNPAQIHDLIHRYVFLCSKLLVRNVNIFCFNRCNTLLICSWDLLWNLLAAWFD